MRRTFIGADGLKLLADVSGEGARGEVLLAHGGGQTRHAWKKAAQALAERGWRAVSLDLRGHGESEWSPVGDYALDAFANDLIEVARQMAARPALIGASLGGIAGLMVETLLAPGTFSSLTLVDVTPRMDPAGVDKIMGFMGAHLESGFSTLDEAADAISIYLPHRPRPADLSGLKKNLRRGADGRWRWHWDPKFVTGMDRRSRGEGRWELLDRLDELRLPVHLIRGAMSELVSEEAAAQFRALVPSAAFTDVAGAGHMVAGDRNDAFAAAAVAFLEGLA
ncbi:MAG TPA: alpha/beta fold hydrolase [Caulobacteraceae bacterium]|nr:alpha/beta fold hydrolase [Caulobacteraceae bacterium]